MISFKFFLLENAQRVAGIKANPAHQNISIDHDDGAKKAGFIHMDPVQRSHTVIDHLASHDPTHDAGNEHTEWMVNQYKKGHMRLEDGPRVGQALRNFRKIKQHLPEKDLNRYTLNGQKEPKKHDLTDTIHGVMRQHEEHNAKFPDGPRFEGHPGAELVHDDGKGTTVHIIKTHEAGRAARASCNHPTESDGWCFGWKKPDHFNSYHGKGPIHLLQTPDNKKTAIHFQDRQFMDIHDRDLDPKRLVKNYPQIKDVKAFKQHGIDSLPFMNRDEQHATLNTHVKDALTEKQSDHPLAHYERANRIAEHIEHEPDLHRHFRPMAEHQDPNIRQIAAARGPHQIKAKLMDDPEAHVRMSVAETTTDPRHLDKLMHDGDTRVQAGVLRNTKTVQPSHAEYLAHHATEAHNREQANWAHFQMTGKPVKSSFLPEGAKPGSRDHYYHLYQHLSKFETDIDHQKRRVMNKTGKPGDVSERKAAYATERMKHATAELKKYFPGVMAYHKDQEARFKGKKSKIPGILAYQGAVMNGLHKQP